jgi:hypothetical protein
MGQGDEISVVKYKKRWYVGTTLADKFQDAVKDNPTSYKTKSEALQIAYFVNSKTKTEYGVGVYERFSDLELEALLEASQK